MDPNRRAGCDHAVARWLPTPVASFFNLPPTAGPSMRQDPFSDRRDN